MFSYLIIFEVNNRFVAFSIDKNFQKSTEIGSQFHNLPTAGYPNPLLPSLSPCDHLSLPVPRLFLSRRVLMLPQFPSVAPQPRLPSPAASCRRLSTAAFPALLLIAALSCLPPVYSSVSPLLPQFPPPDLYCRFPHLPPLSDNFPLSVPAGRLPCLSPVCFSPAASLFFRSHCRSLSTAAFFTPAAFSTLFLSVR